MAVSTKKTVKTAKAAVKRSTLKLAAAKTIPLNRPAGALTDAHIKAAKAAFKNFTLSKKAIGVQAPKNQLPQNADVSKFQQSLIRSEVKTFIDSGPGMMVTVTDPDTFGLSTGKVDLSTLLDAVTAQMRGTQFYMSGKTVVDGINATNQANDIINNIKNPPNNGTA